MNMFDVIEENDEIKEEFKGYKNGLVRYGKERWCFLKSTAAMMQEYKNLEVRSTDIWVVTYPKCGTTWTQEMVWQIANNCNFENEKKLDERYTFLEIETVRRELHGSNMDAPSDTIQKLQQAKNPRFIKSHLPLSLLPDNLLEKAKVIYVARNPKDTMVSFLYHHKLLVGHGFDGDLKTFARRFMKDQILWSPFFTHLQQSWEKKDHPNLLFIFYEDMKNDIVPVIDLVSQFLSKSLTKIETEKLANHLDIKNFRKNESVNREHHKDSGVMSKEGNFVRKGEVGGWKDDFKDDPQLNEEFDQWVSQKLKKCDFEFPNYQ